MKNYYDKLMSRRDDIFQLLAKTGSLDHALNVIKLSPILFSDLEDKELTDRAPFEKNWEILFEFFQVYVSSEKYVFSFCPVK